MNKFKIHYTKVNSLQLKTLEDSYCLSSEEMQYEYNPFQINQLQNFNPIYGEFFQMNEKNYDRIAFNNKYHIKDLNSVIDSETNTILKRSIFIKHSPLLDPLRFMIGKYDLTDAKTRTLPSLENNTIPKLWSYQNSSYIDNFFCYLNSQMLYHHNIINCLDYYGSFLGVQDKFKMNISDDLEYVSSSSFYRNNVGKLFVVDNKNPMEYTNFGSRANKLKLNISATVDLLETEVITDTLTESSSNDYEELLGELIYENVKKTSDDDESEQDDSSSDSSNNSELNYSSDDSEDDESNKDSDDEEHKNSDSNDSDWETETESNDDSDASDNISAYIYNFPIQMICLEKCDGTIDELFMKNKINCENGASALIQIIMILLLFQRSFRFTHNDLHTNNIMYVKTDIPFIYYKFENQMYKVPTYGKIFKIIDFGRAIYRFQGKIFCSDSFAPGGDAATQYNCEPFFNENKPRLEPNYSFDLSRLGTSIYDFVIDNDDDENLDEFQRTIKRWCADDNGKNMLYKKNGDDRYPDFKLYKMISRTVHQHTPENQLKQPYFKQFLTKSIPKKNDPLMDIDSIPCYA